MTPYNKDESHAQMMGWGFDSKLDKVILPETGLQFYDGISNGDLFNIFYKSMSFCLSRTGSS